MIEQLQPDLAALIAAERVAPTASSAVRIAIRAKVATAVAGAPLGVAAAGLGIGKVIAIVALTVGAGTATVAGLKAHATDHDVARGSAAPLVASAPPAPVPRPDETIAPPLVQAAPVAVARPRAAARAAVPVPSQSELIQRAWSSLSGGDPSTAFALVERDAREHPDGALGEERDAVDIVALARLGRLDDARRAADAFRVRYPTSIHLDLIARSLAKESP